MARQAARSESVESNKSKADKAEEIAEETEDEYEIEEVLDAKRGVFPDGRMGYFVKWKNYGQEDNSWVDERDAENARDLVDEFWRKNPGKKRVMDRKSLDKKTAPRKSAAAEDSDTDAKQAKKRRKSTASKAPASDNEGMEVDQPEPPAKKVKKNQISTKASKSQTPELQEKVIGNMEKWRNLNSWEGLITSIDTVEQGANNSLLVYFTLNTGESVVENSEICYKRFPQAMLKFYESNLKWRAVDDE